MFSAPWVPSLVPHMHEGWAHETTVSVLCLPGSVVESGALEKDSKPRPVERVLAFVTTTAGTVPELL